MAGLDATITGQGTLSPKANLELDPTQTQDLLKSMQQMIEQRESPLSQLMSGLKDARAAAVPNLEGEATRAMNTRDVEKRAEQESTFKMKQEMTAYQAALAQQELQREMLKQQLGMGSTPSAGGAGPAAGGAGGQGGLPKQILDAVALEPTLAGKTAIIQKYRTEAALEETKANLNPALDTPQDYMIPGVGPTRLTPRQLRSLPAEVQKRIEQATIQQFGNLPTGGTTAPATGGAQTAGTTAAAPAAKTNAPLSVRNNNPGNLIDPKTGEFRKFATPEEGQTALEADLNLKISGNSPAYKARFGDTPITPATLAETWSPAKAAGNSAASTTNYGKFIANALGILPNEPIPNTPEAKAKVAQAIAQFERGAYQTPVASTAPQVAVQKSLAPNEQIVSQPAATTTAAAPTTSAAATTTAAAPAAQAPATTTAPATVPAAIFPPKPDPTKYGSNLEQYKADVAAWQTQVNEISKGLGTQATEKAKAEEARRNEYEADLKASQESYDELNRLKTNTKGKSKIFNLSGQGIVGPIASAFISEKVDPNDKGATVTKNDTLSRFVLNDQEQTDYKNAKQGAAEAQANWARNLIKGAGGRLTNADISLGGIAKGVGPDQTYSSHMLNLAKQMEAARTVFYRAQAYNEWKQTHPGESVTTFENSKAFEEAKSKARRDVGHEFADIPEANYVHKDKNGRLYVIKPNGKGEYIE